MWIAIYTELTKSGYVEISMGISNWYQSMLMSGRLNQHLAQIEEAAESRVETLDSISGRIAQQLYQKNKIAVQGFETMQFPDSFFGKNLRRTREHS